MSDNSPTIITPTGKASTTVTGSPTIYFTTLDGLRVETWIKPAFIPPEGASVQLDGQWWTVLPGGIGFANPITITIVVDRSRRR